ncbi:MAG: dephospho-CoA kinase [Candidatus Dormibacterales bacterium]
MKLIGLTGGAGSGKSTVAQMFRDLGAEVVDADDAAHAAYEPGSTGFQQVVAEFGSDYVRDGRIDRERLGQLVFNDERARRRLNAIVHPLVRERMAARTAEALVAGKEIVLHDVPLLYENGLESVYLEIVVVYVPPDVQLKRLVEGRGLKLDRAQAIIASQLPIEEKRMRATYVIDNRGSRSAALAQVRSVWELLTS